MPDEDCSIPDRPADPDPRANGREGVSGDRGRASDVRFLFRESPQVEKSFRREQSRVILSLFFFIFPTSPRVPQFVAQNEHRAKQLYFSFRSPHLTWSVGVAPFATVSSSSAATSWSARSCPPVSVSTSAAPSPPSPSTVPLPCVLRWSLWWAFRRVRLLPGGVVGLVAQQLRVTVVPDRLNLGQHRFRLHLLL